MNSSRKDFYFLRIFCLFSGEKHRHQLLWVRLVHLVWILFFFPPIIYAMGYLTTMPCSQIIVHLFIISKFIRTWEHMKLFQKVSRTWKLILECVPIKSYSLIRPREMFNMYIFLRKTDFWGWTEDEEWLLYLSQTVYWEWCWSYFGIWSWRPFWQLLIALNRAATILCNQGVVFQCSWTSALSFFQSSSSWHSKNMKAWDKTRGGCRRWEVRIQGSLAPTSLMPLLLLFTLNIFTFFLKCMPASFLVTYWRTSQDKRGFIIASWGF